MSAQLALFAVPPSLTDVSDRLNIADARASFYVAEQKGDAALAVWARAYGLSFVERAEEALEMHTDAELEQAVDRAEATSGLEPADVVQAVGAAKAEASDRVVQAVAGIEAAKGHVAERRTTEALGLLNVVVRVLKPLIVANHVVAAKA